MKFVVGLVPPPPNPSPPQPLIPAAPTSAELFASMLRMQGTFPLAPKRPVWLTRGSWLLSEDELLSSAIGHLGTKSWNDIACHVPSRTSKQCRERWFNWLNPGIKHDRFQPWEDQLIVAKQREYGNKWSTIANHLPGRSTNAVKNRWYSGLRPRERQSADPCEDEICDFQDGMDL
jgi:hypothetical protein